MHRRLLRRRDERLHAAQSTLQRCGVLSIWRMPGPAGGLRSAGARLLLRPSDMQRTAGMLRRCQWDNRAMFRLMLRHGKRRPPARPRNTGRCAWLALLPMLVACASHVSVEKSDGTSSGSGSAGTGDWTGACETLGHAACLAVYPDCVPVYDQSCCPSCNPGPCGACVLFLFHHCASHAEGCSPTLPCGFSLPEHCAGKLPACGDAADVIPCGTYPGCSYAICPVGVDCDPAKQCVPVTAGSCTVLCKLPPPDCPPGMVAEADGNCWTGLCVRAEVCATP
jgi:hypothetical protein